MKKFQLFFVAPQIGFVLCVLFAVNGARAEHRAPTLEHEIVATIPHNENDFTQGLAIHDGAFVESTGGRGQSALMRKNIADGKVLQKRVLPRDQFGEGVAAVGDRLIQLTWTAGVAWIYGPSLQPAGHHTYQGQGWGLAFDGERLMMSDGSARITFRDPDTFEVTGAIEVSDAGAPVRRLNELEYARGWLYANVWQDDRIAVIDPGTGAVRGWHDLSSLKKGFAKPAAWRPAEHVLNGIAWHPERKTFYVTGKCWPVMYEVRFAEPADQAGSGN